MTEHQITRRSAHAGAPHTSSGSGNADWDKLFSKSR